MLKWFAANARDLPWRRIRDPYAIHVSEIMLQQTQVKTVIPYWERWLSKLPTIQSLAEADSDLIHKLWEGLGYYTRVRNLQKAAQEIVARHGGVFPREHASILELPGIGPYTAGAISSIAFNEPQPILDGNVIRVLTRVFAIAENPREKSTNKELWNLASQLVTAAAGLKTESFAKETARCSALNQSLMELGALICTPRQPDCPRCPLRAQCRAHELHREEAFPNLGPRAAATQQNYVALVIKQRGRFLVRQRPAGVVNAHLWEFPNFQTAAYVQNELTDLAHKNLNLAIADSKPICVVKHSITRYRITLQAFSAKAAPSDKIIALLKLRWLTLEELHALTFTSAHKKILLCLSAV
ncbi:MAG TPA: A/G-specific adenine glycosylase [Verrucomicrobiae bacterium]|nr:A/G-specific adenine glycosylase [Verrucomicrobiae bacterium]